MSATWSIGNGDVTSLTACILFQFYRSKGKNKNLAALQHAENLDILNTGSYLSMLSDFTSQGRWDDSGAGKPKDTLKDAKEIIARQQGWIKPTKQSYNQD